MTTKTDTKIKTVLEMINCAEEELNESDSKRTGSPRIEGFLDALDWVKKIIKETYKTEEE